MGAFSQSVPLELANKLGVLLNGTVVQTNPGGPVAPAPQYALDFGTGTDPRNAGLMHQLLTTEDPILAQMRIAAEEAYLRNPPSGPVPGSPVGAPVFRPAAGGHQAQAGPVLTSPQVANAIAAFQPAAAAPPPEPTPAQPQPQPQPQSNQSLSLSDIGAVLNGLSGGGGGQINLQNPASYAPGAGMAQYQPLQSLFAAPAYQRSQPGALMTYLGRAQGRGY